MTKNLTKCHLLMGMSCESSSGTIILEAKGSIVRYPKNVTAGRQTNKFL